MSENFRPGTMPYIKPYETVHTEGDADQGTAHEINMEQYGEDFEPCKLYVDSGKLPSGPYVDHENGE